MELQRYVSFMSLLRSKRTSKEGEADHFEKIMSAGIAGLCDDNPTSGAPVTWALGQMSSWHPPAFPATTGTTKRALYEELCGQESVLEECFGASRRKAYPGEFSMVVGYDIATRNDTYVEAFQTWSPCTCLDNREQNSVRTGAPAAAFETKRFATPPSSEFYGAPVYDS